MSRLDDVISDVGYILDCLKALRSIWETGHDCKSNAERNGIKNDTTRN